MDFVVMKLGGKISCIPLEEYKLDSKKFDWQIAAVLNDCSDVPEAVYRFALDICPKEEILKVIKAYLEDQNWEINPIFEAFTAEEIEKIDLFLDGQLLVGLEQYQAEDGSVWWE